MGGDKGAQKGEIREKGAAKGCGCRWSPRGARRVEAWAKGFQRQDRIGVGVRVRNSFCIGPDRGEGARGEGLIGRLGGGSGSQC